jgi:hypothetical protein
MNERILDLAIQAKDWAYADHDGYTAQMLFEQKFAELIVRQCMALCEDVTERNDPAIACYYEIKQHFLGEEL